MFPYGMKKGTLTYWIDIECTPNLGSWWTITSDWWIWAVCPALQGNSVLHIGQPEQAHTLSLHVYIRTVLHAYRCIDICIDTWAAHCITANNITLSPYIATLPTWYYMSYMNLPTCSEFMWEVPSPFHYPPVIKHGELENPPLMDDFPRQKPPFTWG